VQNFEKLRVWSDSLDLTRRVYRLTEQLPHEEKFGLVSQMRRASVSITSNIAEGTGRATAADFARFLQMAIGSTCELLSQIQVVVHLHLVDESDAIAVTDCADMVRRKLINLKSEVEGVQRRT
jgi:four helix bundle protein